MISIIRTETWKWGILETPPRTWGRPIPMGKGEKNKIYPRHLTVRITEFESVNVGSIPAGDVRRWRK